MFGFRYRFSNGVGYFTIDEFERTGKVLTCFSSRIGGISAPPFDSLNLGYKSGDKKENVDENFKRLCGAAGFKFDELVLSDQVHGDKCRTVGYGDRGKGTIYDSNIRETDALITGSRDTALCIFTADCVPVFLLDTENNAIGLCHAGWRGIASSIISKTISQMAENYGSKPSCIMAAIGPSIGPCCFNVGPDVADRFESLFKGRANIVIKDDAGLRISLWEAAKTQLMDTGINPDSIINSGLCTSCKGDLFFSYRRDNSKTGRMVSIIQLR